MNYELYFHPKALKEWKKLSSELRNQFKKILVRRLEKPHIPTAALKGQLKNCYKIKLQAAGYRLVYQVDDEKFTVLVIVIGKRNKNEVYELAALRHLQKHPH